jgi:hypothetical protein
MVYFQLSTFRPKEFIMRPIFLSLCFILCAGTVNAAVPPVGEQMRAVELQRQAEESGRWLEKANVIYFKTVAADQIVDPDKKAALDKIADPYRERFLNPKQADHLCGLIKEFLKSDGYSLDGFFCSVKGGVLKVKVSP